MKKALLVFILSLFILNSQAQWESESTGFSVSRGITQIIAPSKTAVWVTGFDAATNTATKCRDYCHSSDGGATWTAATLSSAASSANWSCMAAVDENTAWALLYKTTAAGGWIWHTTDGGTTWTQQGASQVYAGSSSFPDVIHFWDANTGVVVGDPLNNEFEIYTTSDGGTTWTAVDGANIPDPLAGEYGLTRCLAVYNDVIWFGTNEGRVFKSTDHGLTWTVYDTGLNSNAIYSVVFSDEDNGWIEMYDASGVFLGLYRTTDGGTTWSDITPSDNFYVFYGFCYVPKTTNVLVSAGYDAVSSSYFGSSYSLDGGDTWVNIDSGASSIHLAVTFYDNITGWSGGVNDIVNGTGGMWKYTDGFVATGTSAPSALEDGFKLYPNPSDGLFYFSFDIQNNDPIHITITDALGRIVVDNTYKDKSQTWLRSIDMRNYPKGVYSLNIENNGERSTRMLVIQ